VPRYDYIIVGGGLAGLYAAWKSSAYGTVALITKSIIRESNSYYAQGGIAAVTHEEDDTTIHFNDTLTAGAGLCDKGRVDILVNEGPDRIREIIDEGMKFDQENGELALGLEGGHHFKRILHSGGDATGRMIVEFMIDKVLTSQKITLYENYSLESLITHEGICFGAICRSDNGSKTSFFSKHTILSTGGASAIYSRSTNPPSTLGEGIAICYKAGCRIADMEFIQFHPTALFAGEEKTAFLISEAVRGEGAHLLNKKGERFMLSVHPLAELAPRDIVSAEIYKQMLKEGSSHVTLSLKHLDSNRIISRFPTIYQTCLKLGMDLTDNVPVSPAAHYTIGGVETDEFGMTNIENLFVCGELASTGVMGANRLASNSLLECLVFVHRAVAITSSSEYKYLHKLDSLSQNSHYVEPDKYLAENDNVLFGKFKRELSDVMMRYVGIVRDEESLIKGQNEVRQLEASYKNVFSGWLKQKTMNLIVVADLIFKSAIYRKESRGAHLRSDYPSNSTDYLFHTIIEKDRIYEKPVDR